MAGGQSVAGKAVLVTGAARGIGAESARRLAARGARVSLVGLEPEILERTATEIGGGAIWFEADVTDADATQRAVDGTVEQLGGVDVVIANAGIAAGGTVRTMDPVAWDRIVEVNLLGAVRTVRACLPQVIERRGYVLAIASAAAAVHGPLISAYAASKAGVEAFANSLRLEVAHLGVGVGVGYFWWIGTDMVRGADELPEVGERRRRAPGILSKVYPVSDAADAVARGIERRDRWVVAPPWLRAVLLGRGVANLLLERGGRREAAEVVGLAEADVASRGAEASRAVGAGGAADNAARTG